MKMVLEMNDAAYSVEMRNDDMSGSDLIELFSRLMVVAGYPPSVIRLPEDEGHYEYVGENEEVIERRKD